MSLNRKRPISAPPVRRTTHSHAVHDSAVANMQRSLRPESAQTARRKVGHEYSLTTHGGSPHKLARKYNSQSLTAPHATDPVLISEQRARHQASQDPFSLVLEPEIEVGFARVSRDVFHVDDFETSTAKIDLSFHKRSLIFDSFQRFRKSRNVTEIQSSGARDKSVDNTGGTQIYTWGVGYYGQLGRPTRSHEKCSRVPTLVDLNEPILQVACGSFHTAALTASGHLYTWGDGRSGQLGNLDNKRTILHVPRLVDGLEHQSITFVACGQRHTCAVTDHGALWSWGSNRFGQLGNGTRFDERYPRTTLIDAIVIKQAGRCVEVSCGDRHTLALTSRGRVLSWGVGEHGQLGHGEDCGDLLRPKLIAADAFRGQRVVKIDAASTHSAAVTEDGSLYLWGFGENIHPSSCLNICFTPRRVKFKARVADVASGQGHIAVLTQAGDVYVFGSGKEGQLGHGRDVDCVKPRLVLKDKQVRAISCGRYHTVAVTQLGVMYSWGCGESGQLGHDDTHNCRLPRVVSSTLGNVVASVAAGEHHTICLSSGQYGLGQDMVRWRTLEQQEFNVKSTMLKSAPFIAGLKTKDIRFVEQERRRLEAVYDAKQAKQQDDSEKQIGETVKSIKAPQQIHRESKTQLLLDPPAGHPATKQLVRSTQEHRRSSSRQFRLNLPGQKSSGNSSSSMSRHTRTGSKRPSGTKSTTERKRAFMTELDSTPRFNGMVPVGPLVASGAGTYGGAFEKPMETRSEFLGQTRNTLRMVKDTFDRENQEERQQMAKAAETYKLRKDFDKLKNKTSRMVKTLQSLERSLSFLRPTKSEQEETSHVSKRLQEVKMQLLTIDRRIVEAAENKKNYKLNIIRMKEEEVSISKQCEDMRLTLLEQTHMLAKMKKMYGKISEETQHIADQRSTLDQEMQDYQVFFARQKDSYHAVLQSKVHRDLRVEKYREQRALKQERGNIRRIKRLEAEFESTEQKSAKTNEQLAEVQHREQHLAVEFQKICNATGLSDVQEIINKYFFHAEVDGELHEDIHAKQVDVKRLERELAVVKHQAGHDNERAHQIGDEQRWKTVESLQDRQRAAEARLSKHRQLSDQALADCALMQEGLIGLVQHTNQVTGQHDDSKSRPQIVNTITIGGGASGDFSVEKLEVARSCLEWLQFLDTKLDAIPRKQELEAPEPQSRSQLDQPQPSANQVDPDDDHGE